MTNKRRPFTSFPVNEAGLVDKFLGTAYDTVKAVYLTLDELIELNNKIEELDSIYEDYSIVKDSYEFYKSNYFVVVVKEEKDLDKIDTEIVKSARVVIQKPNGAVGYKEFIFINSTWKEVYTSFSDDQQVNNSFVYNNGSAKGGEYSIKIPNSADHIVTIFINGLRNLVDDIGYFDKDKNIFHLHKSLEKGDEVVFIFSDNEISLADFKYIKNLVEENKNRINIFEADWEEYKQELNKELQEYSEKTNKELNNKRDLDNNVFNGLMTIKSDNDEQGVGILLQESDGTLRGQVVATDQGLQLTQYPKDGGIQTFTFPGEGGEIVINSKLPFITPEMYGAVGDGVSDDTDALDQAVARAKAMGAYVVINHSYKVSDTFNPMGRMFTGSGQFVYGSGDVWKASNKGDHENVIYIQGTSSTNSGAVPSQPISLSAAINRIKGMGSVLDGMWVLHFKAGTHTYNGVRLYNMPLFIRYLKFRGEGVPWNSEPVSVWDGTNSQESYALLGQNPQSIPYRFEFENLKAINWYKDGKDNSGFCVLWQQATVYTRNLWFDNVSFGVSIRQGYMRCHGGKAFNSREPYGVKYTAIGNFGSLNKEDGIYIENCDIGVSNGRNAIMYIQNVHFNRCRVDISSTRLSRFRSQACTHEEWEDYAYDVRLGSVQTPDNSAGHPDKFKHSDPFKPVLKLAEGSVHMHCQKGTGDIHNISPSRLIVPPDIADRTIITNFYEGTSRDWQPFRLPSFFLNSVGATIKISLILDNARGIDGTLRLYSSGSGARSAISSIINISKEPTIYTIKFTITNIGDNTLQCVTEVNGEVSLRYLDLSTGYFSELSEEMLVGRVYVTTGSSTSNTAWVLSNMVTTVNM